MRRLFSKMSLAALSAFVFLTVGTAFSYAQKPHASFTLVYTGNAQARLYPIKFQNKLLGGISPRADFVDSLRKKHRHLLLVEGPGAIAGSLKDMDSINEELDRKRTLAYFNALGAIGYDLICIGIDDLERFSYISGWDYGQVKLLSIGHGADNALEANRLVSIEKNGVKIGFVAMYDAGIKNLDKAFGRLKVRQNNDLVALVVLDGTSPEVIKSNKKALLNHSDIILLPELSYLSLFESSVDGNLAIFDKDSSTLIVAPKWGGSMAAVVDVAVDNGKITEAAIEASEIKASEKINPKVKGILPVCFSDSDCRAEKGMVCHCVNPGGENAKCECSAKHPYSLTALLPRNCISCNAGRIKSWLNEVFADGVVLKDVYMDSAKGKELIEALNLKYLPAYLLPLEIKKDKHFYAIKESVVKTDFGYLLRPEAAGVSVYVGRQRAPKRLDVFFSPILSNKYVAMLVKKAYALRKQMPDWDIRLDYAVKTDSNGNVVFPNGKSESAEAVAQLCVEKYMPERIGNFISCRFLQGYPQDILPCLSGESQEVISKVAQCMESPAEVSFLLTGRIRLSQELGINSPGIILFENQQVLGVSPSVLTVENLKRWSEQGDKNPEKE